MRVSAPRLDVSPRDETRQRVSVDVRYDDRPGDSEEYWIDLPTGTGAQPASSGNAWVVALLPLAATLGEPLEIDAPVDQTLLGNLGEVLRIWREWYPRVRPVDVRCGAIVGDGAPRGTRVGAMFSGGVDSFFTLLRPRETLDETRQVEIDTLVTIFGFDIPLHRHEAFGRLRERVAGIAAESGCLLLDLATNIRETRWREVDWGYLGHGCALVAVCHALDDVIGTVLVPSGAYNQELGPWASHPATDPLLSSQRLEVVHDGASVRRVDKLALLAESPMALRELRVCFRDESDRNCGACPKCVRTMLTLELLGALSETGSFGGVPTVSARVARRLHCRWPWDFVYTNHVRELAGAHGRRDLARALTSAMSGSRWRNRALEWISPARRRRSTAWVPRTLEAALLRGWVR